MLIAAIIAALITFGVFGAILWWSTARLGRTAVASETAYKTAMRSVMEPYRRGDYEAALSATEGLLTVPERRRLLYTQFYYLFRGVFLGELARVDDAEASLRRYIALLEEGKGQIAGLSESHDNRRLASGVCALGELMLKTGRVAEARELFGVSMRHNPDDCDAYLATAESYLMQRDDPAEALRWARLAVEHAQTDSFPKPQLRRLNLAGTVATLAWATAVNSRNAEEVTLWITEAIGVENSGHVLTRARVQHHAGCAYAELGDTENSARHYGECARLDTQGSWGREARRKLESLRGKLPNGTDPSQT